jgi:hypothetical protein
MATDIAEKLVEARKLIERGWTRKVYARTKSGKETTLTRKSATCFCAMGAIGRVFDDDDPNFYTPGMRFLAAAIGTDPIYEWNDAPGRTQAEVLAAFDKAIELARAA